MIGDVEERTLALRHHWLPVFLPAAIHSTGMGTVGPITAVIAIQYGADLGTASIVAGLTVIGRLVGNVPSAWLIQRIGERWSMIIAAIAAMSAAGIAISFPYVPVLCGCILVIGVASAAFMIGRHALLTRFVSFEYRARALSLLAGMNMLGFTIGPFIAAGVIAVWSAAATLYVLVATCVLVSAILLLIPDPEKRFGGSGGSRSSHARTGQWETFLEHRAPLLRVGVGAGILLMLKGTKSIVMQIWGVSIGIPEHHIALAIGISHVIEVVLFYTSGQIMDRWGRRVVAVPVTLGLALGHIAFLAVVDLVSFYVVALLLGLVNSIGAGIIMTLGSDLAPPGNTAAFLGAWRVINDGGSALGPALIATATIAFTPAAAVLAIGGIGLVGAWMLWRWIPQYIDGVERT